MRLTGPVRVVGRDRRLVTPVELGRGSGLRGKEVALPAKDRPPTLATVAASAGVSVATVSKVVNGRADVGPETRALVRACCEEHEYVARRARRRARSVESRTVELVFHGELNAVCAGDPRRAWSTAGAELGISIAVSHPAAAGPGGKPTVGGVGAQPGPARPAAVIDVSELTARAICRRSPGRGCRWWPSTR